MYIVQMSMCNHTASSIWLVRIGREFGGFLLAVLIGFHKLIDTVLTLLADVCQAKVEVDECGVLFHTFLNSLAASLV